MDCFAFTVLVNTLETHPELLSVQQLADNAAALLASDLPLETKEKYAIVIMETLTSQQRDSTESKRICKLISALSAFHHK